MTTENLGQWGSLTLEMPDFLEDVREAINSVAEFLLTLLDIALAALQLIKAFAFALLDPITPIIQAVIDIINGIIRDLAQMGLYFTHDAGMFAEGFPFRSMRQGYQGYERRMIARLTDRTDPTRPDISTATPVFGAFFYLSVDFTQIERLIKFIQKLVAMFTGEFSFTGNYPAPVITRVDYGPEATGIFGGISNLTHFKLDGTPPDKARVSFKVPNPERQDIYAPLAAFAGPKDFIITVSTEPEGMHLMYRRPQQDSGSDRTDKGSGKLQQRTEQGPCLDDSGKPIIVHGGWDELKSATTGAYNDGFNSDGTFKNGQAVFFGIFNPSDSASKAVIPLDKLFDGSKYFFQRQFFLSGFSGGAQSFLKEFSYVLDYEDMPHKARLEVGSDNKVTLVDEGKPTSYYVRIASCADSIGTAGIFQWDLGDRYWQGALAGVPFRLKSTGGTLASVRGSYSQAKKIRFPVGGTLQFLDAVQTALAILVLSRSDLPLVDDAEETLGSDVTDAAREHKVLLDRTCLLGTGLEPFLPLVDQFYRDDIEAPNQDPDKFRRKLASAVGGFAKKLLDDGDPSGDTIDFVVENTKELREVTLKKLLEKNYSDVNAIWDVKQSEQTLVEHMKGKTPDATNEEFELWKGLVESESKEIELLEQLISTDQLEKAYTKAEIFQQKYKSDLRFLKDNLAESKKNLAQVKAESVVPALGSLGGVAPNLYSMGVENAANLLNSYKVIRERKPDFIEYSQNIPAPKATISADDLQEELKKAPPFLRAVYLQNMNEDQSMTLSPEYVERFKSKQKLFGSADFVPVLYYQKPGQLQKWANAPYKGDTISKDGAVIPLRTLIREYEGGILYQQAALTLQMAAAHAMRSAADGEWIAIRFFDSIPAFEDFLEAIQNWIKALKAAFQSIIDAIIEYIEFIEARLIELQQLIRKINALLQSILGYMLDLPSCHFLPLLENGTSGIVRGLAGAENKPQDSIRAHGGGAAMIVALLPGLAGQLIQALLLGLLAPPDDGDVAVTQPGAMFSPDAIPAEPAEGPDDEPDVL